MSTASHGTRCRTAGGACFDSDESVRAGEVILYRHHGALGSLEVFVRASSRAERLLIALLTDGPVSVACVQRVSEAIGLSGSELTTAIQQVGAVLSRSESCDHLRLPWAVELVRRESIE